MIPGATSAFNTSAKCKLHTARAGAETRHRDIASSQPPVPYITPGLPGWPLAEPSPRNPWAAGAALLGIRRTAVNSFWAQWVWYLRCYPCSVVRRNEAGWWRWWWEALDFLPCMLGLNQLRPHLESSICQLWFMYTMFSEGPLRTSALCWAEQQSGWPFGALFFFSW